MRFTRLAVIPVCVVCLFAVTRIAGAQTVPHSSHVWILNEENHSFEEVVGNSQMPYFNQLISQYGLATQFYSDQHGSLPALMWFVAGAPVTTNEDTVSCNHTGDNVVRELLNQGYSWRSYQEDLPYPGYQGLYGGSGNKYYRRHNPLIDFSDVCPGTGQDLNIVPYTQLADDVSDGTTINFAWVTPDVDHDAHSGTLSAADQWLQANVPAILARPEFQPGGDGILFIVWDESELQGDDQCSATVLQGCGGHTATLVIGPQVTPGYQSTITYHNENVLATVCAAMGLTTCPGAAQSAAPMADFFNGSQTPSGVQILSPTSGEIISAGSPVHVVAQANEPFSVSQLQVWDNGVKLGHWDGSTVDQYFNLGSGTHQLTVTDHNQQYVRIHQSTVTFTVQ